MAQKFDGLQYIASYPDLIEAFGADAAAGRQHYLQSASMKVVEPTPLTRSST